MIMKQNYDFPSSFILILLLSNLLPYSSLAMRKLEDAEIDRIRESSMDLRDQSFVEGDHVQRKELHEVHSGPNPISNSHPQQNSKTKLNGYP